MNEEEIFKADPGDEKAFRVASLIAGYLRDELSSEEHRELDDWVTESEHNQRIFEKLTDPDQLKTMLAWKERLDTEQALKHKSKKIEQQAKSSPVGRIRPWKFAIAAILLLAISIVLISKFVLTHESEPANKGQLSADISPGFNRATLILGNGSQINLDSSSKGLLKSGTQTEIENTGTGEIRYRVSGTDSSLISPLNTLVVPAGGQFKIWLSDGTIVWLNAKSRLRYPEKFIGPQRSVILEGEAYFEVEKDTSRPFVVATKTMSIEVLGTHFNVNSYNDNGFSSVTLAEGRVRINQSVSLEPGQQANVDSSGTIKTESANLESVLAWKNGIFDFKNASLNEIMPQLSRWYNATIEFETQIPEHFNATIQRSVPVSKLLHILEGTGAVHFTITNKKIIVSK